MKTLAALALAAFIGLSAAFPAQEEDFSAEIVKRSADPGYSKYYNSYGGGRRQNSGIGGLLHTFSHLAGVNHHHYDDHVHFNDDHRRGGGFRRRLRNQRRRNRYKYGSAYYH